MRKHLKVVWLLLFALLLTSCSAPGTPSVSPTETPEPTPTTPPVSTPMPGQEERADRTAITIGMMNFSSGAYNEFGQERIEEAVRLFNLNSSEYTAEIEYYGDFSASNSDALLALNAALTSSENVPDLLYLTGLPTEAYIQRGLLMDLGPLMDADKTLTREDMLPCVREASEVDGKIFYLSPDCSIMLYGGNSETLMTEDFADTEQVFRALEAQKDKGRTLMQDLGAAAFASADALADRFVDYESGTCSFQSEEFLRVLELLDRLPRSLNRRFPVGASDYSNSALWVTEGYSVMFYNSIDRFEAYVEQETLMDGDYVPAEYPFSDGKYALCTLETPIAIPTNAAHPEGAWEFVHYLFQPMITSDKNDIPTTYSDLADALEDSGLPKLWEKQREGEKDVREQMSFEMDDPHGTIQVGAEVVTLQTYPYTEEVYEEFLELLKKPMVLQIGGSRSAKTAELQNMISDEINAFLDGNATAEQTAQALQSRVEIYLAEQI